MRLATVLAILACLLQYQPARAASPEDLEAALNALRPSVVNGTADTCPDADGSLALLRQIAQSDARPSTLSRLLSKLMGRGAQSTAGEIAVSAFEEVIMPAIACGLSRRAGELMGVAKTPAPASLDTLDSSRQDFLDLIRNVRDLEISLQRFARVSGGTDRAEIPVMAADFNALAAFAFDKPLPEELKRAKGAYAFALSHMNYTKPLALPEGARMHYSRLIETMARDLRDILSRELTSGASLLKDARRTDEPEAQRRNSDRHLLSWLNWMRQSWVGASPTRNPCEDIRVAAAPLLADLTRLADYPGSLENLSQTFDENQCFRPSVKTLSAMNVAPWGRLFVRNGDALEPSPELAPEFIGLAGLKELRFMGVEPAAGFQCKADLVGWDTSRLAAAGAHAREYLAFRQSRKQPPSSEQTDSPPIHELLARRQFLVAMNGAMNAAQIPRPAPAEETVPAPADSGFSRESADFNSAYGPLLDVLRLYQQLGFGASARSGAIARCAADYVADSLRRIMGLAYASQFYAVPGAGSAFPETTDTAVTKDWLSVQFTRSQVLAGYASPYLAFLRDIPITVDSPELAFWGNTVQEINRHIQFRDMNGQVAHLENLILKTLPGMTPDTCHKQLADYIPPEYGNDLFSRLRAWRLEETKLRCEDRRTATALMAYRILADRFNRGLAGRYPFAPPDAPDASPHTLRTFLDEYAVQRKQLNEVPDGDKPAQVQAGRFLAQMDRVAAFFGADTSIPAGSTPIRMKAQFRTLPKLSIGAEQIASWRLSSGENMAAYPNHRTGLDWTWGQTVVLDLDWAQGSLWRPMASAEQNDLQVDGATASFAATGPWALLRLIQAHRLPARTATENGIRMSLRFEVPVQGQGKSPGAKPVSARVHLDLEFANGAPQLPFPTHAPGIR